MRTSEVCIRGGKHRMLRFGAGEVNSALDWRDTSSQTAGRASCAHLRGHQISISKYRYLDLFCLVLNVSGGVVNFDDISYVITGFISGLERSNLERDCGVSNVCCSQVRRMGQVTQVFEHLVGVFTVRILRQLD